MFRVGLKKFALLAAVLMGLGGMVSQSQAAPIAFASFQQTNSGSADWTFSNTGATSTFNVSNLAVNFQGSPFPNQILNFTNLFAGTNGSVLATLTSHVSSTATSAGIGQPISQPLAAGAELKFVNASNTSDVILDVVFTGAITGTNGGSGSLAAATLAGQAISYSSNHLLGSFNTPFSFSLSLNPSSGLTMAGNNYLNSFTTVSSGTFLADQSGAGPAPLPAAVWGGLSLMGAVAGMGVVRRRRR